MAWCGACRTTAARGCTREAGAGRTTSPRTAAGWRTWPTSSTSTIYFYYGTSTKILLHLILLRYFYIYENQRWNPLSGFSSSGLPTDRYMWSDRCGHPGQYLDREFSVSKERIQPTDPLVVETFVHMVFSSLALLLYFLSGTSIAKILKRSFRQRESRYHEYRTHEESRSYCTNSE